MKLGIIGFGNHLEKKTFQILKKNNNFKITEFYSRSVSKGKRIQKEYKIKFIKDRKEFFESKNFNAIYIATPPLEHFNDIKEAIYQKKNVICEKPIALNPKDYKFLFNMAKKNKVYLLEVCHYKHDKHFKEIKKIILRQNNKNKTEAKNLYLSFKIPMLDKNNFRLDKNFENSSLYDLGFYPLDFVCEIYKNFKIINYNYFNKNNNIYGNLKLKSAQTNIIISWGIGFSYTNQLSFFTSNIFLYSNFVFTKPKKYKPVINIINKQHRKINIKFNIDKSFPNMFDEYYKILIKKNDLKYKEHSENIIKRLKNFVKISKFKNK